MRFGNQLDKYIVMKLPLDECSGRVYALEAGFEIAGSELRAQVRNDEKRLLELYFQNWLAPYSGNLKGWRDDSPIYVLYKGKLVSGLYVCDKNEFNCGDGWGQLHFFFTNPAFKRRRLHSILVKEAIERAKSWNLQGVVISTDRYGLDEVYIRWGATLWKEIRKVRPAKVRLALARRFLSRVNELIRVLRFHCRD